MATVTTIHYLDDLDGSDADETVEFGIDGRGYEADLSEGNAKELRSVLAPFIESARRVPAPGARRRRAVAGVARRSVLPTAVSPQVMRDWARGQGMRCADRGRVPRDVKAAYEAAHQH